MTAVARGPSTCTDAVGFWGDIDQESIFWNAGINMPTGGDEWYQSFTAGRTGALSGFSLLGNGKFTKKLTVTILSGAGLLGEKLHTGEWTFTTTQSGQWITYDIQTTDLIVETGQVYSIQLQGTGGGSVGGFLGASAGQGQYARGRFHHTNNAGFDDVAFKTYVLGDMSNVSGGICTHSRVLATYEKSADDESSVGNYTCASNELVTGWDLDFTTYDADEFGLNLDAVDKTTAETTFKLGPFIYTTSKSKRSGKVSANGGVAVAVSVAAELDGNDMMNVYVNDINLQGNPNSVNSGDSGDGTLIELTSFASRINADFTYTPKNDLSHSPTTIKYDFKVVESLPNDVDFDPSFTCQVRKKRLKTYSAPTGIHNSGTTLTFANALVGTVQGYTVVQYNSDGSVSASGVISSYTNLGNKLELVQKTGDWATGKIMEVFDPSEVNYELRVLTSPGQTITNNYSMYFFDLNSFGQHAVDPCKNIGPNVFNFTYDTTNTQYVRPQDAGVVGSDGAKNLLYDVVRNTNLQDDIGQHELNLFILFVSESCGFQLALPERIIIVADADGVWRDLPFDAEISRDDLPAQ